jgi:hypothetical protein
MHILIHHIRYTFHFVCPSTACPRHDRATAFGVAYAICVISQNGTFPPFRIWAARFPSRHHQSTTAPSIHRTVALAQVEHNHERFHRLAPPLVQGCGRHVIAVAEDWLAASSDQWKQAGHARGGWCAIHEAGGPYIHRLVHTNILARGWPGLRRPGFGSCTRTSSQTPFATSLTS